MTKGDIEMTAKRKRAKPTMPGNKDQLSVEAEPGKSGERRLADVSLDPAAGAMTTTRAFITGSFGKQNTTEVYSSLREKGQAATAGELDHYKAMLAAQADTLNSIFNETARRAALNMGEYIEATEKYLRLGLKAQAQCRATIEALDKITNGRVQTVRHVHVNEGGQAVIADEFHNHTGGMENAKSNEQPHATGAVGKRAEMLSADAGGDGVPISSGKGSEKVQDARG